jgi:branched-chain amino acid transport system substrate-binding protein
MLRTSTRLAVFLALVGTVTIPATSAIAKEYVVAQVAPFGGAQALAGRDFNLGLIVGLDEINAKGGINGHTFRLVSRDDGYRPEDTTRLVRQVVAELDPLVLVGLTGSANADAVVSSKVLEAAQLPVVAIRTGATGLRGHRLLFHTRTSHADEATRMAEQMLSLGLTRLAIFHEDDPAGKDGLTAVSSALAGRNLKPVIVASHMRNAADFSAQAAQVAKAAPQAVLFFTNTPAAAAFTKALRAQGSAAQLLMNSAIEAEGIVKELGTQGARGIAIAQVSPNPYRQTSELAVAFQRTMRALGLPPARANFASLEGYAAARIIGRAFAAAGATPTRESMVKALEALGKFDPGGIPLDFSPGRKEGTSYVDLSVIGQDGRVLQ